MVVLVYVCGAAGPVGEGTVGQCGRRAPSRARGGMAAAGGPASSAQLAALPTADEVDQRSFTRAKAEALIRDLGGTVPKGAGVSVAAVKEVLKGLLAAPSAENCAPGPSRSGAGVADGAPHKSAVSNVDALVAGSAAARTPGALLFVMRQRLDPDAHPLPKGADSLRKIRASLDLLQVAQRQKDPELWIDDQGVLQPAAWVRKLHQTVKATICLADATMREARQNTLRTAIEEGLSSARKGTSGRGGADSAGVERATPILVLRVLGEAGRRRLMWEYYKAWCVQKPELSKAATLTYADGSYMQTLYQAVSEHLHDVGLSGNKEMASVKSFRDLLGRWCLLGSHYLPPFKRQMSETRAWSADVWDQLPLIDPENLEDLPGVLVVAGGAGNGADDDDCFTEREQIARAVRRRRRGQGEQDGRYEEDEEPQM